MLRPFGFSIDKEFIPEALIMKIYSHHKQAGVNAWWIEEDALRLYGKTWYDNFGMVNYLQSIGVDMSKIVWEY